MIAIPKSGFRTSRLSAVVAQGFFFLNLPLVFCVLIEKRTLERTKDYIKLLWGIQFAKRVVIIAGYTSDRFFTI